MLRDQTRTTLYVDGGCHGNSHLAVNDRTVIACVTDEDGHVLVDKVSRGGSNNIAELWAVLEALKWCDENTQVNVLIKTDSQNNLSWALGKKPGRDINDRPRVVAMQEQIAILRARLDKFQITWVPRHQNLAGHHIESKYSL